MPGTDLAIVAAVGFEGSYLWQLRQKIGNDLVLMPGARVLVFDDAERVLLIRRSDTGWWSMPAGAAEPDASFARTAVRELEEETGLRADVADLEAFGCVSDPERGMVTYPNGDQVRVFGLCFVAHVWSGVLEARDGEALELDFFARHALPRPRHAQVEETLAMWDAYRKTGRFQAF
ncbi:MAG: NUDIX domain-containing protein [Actinopolymorphaceae bacterium]